MMEEWMGKETESKGRNDGKMELWNDEEGIRVL